MKLSALLLLVGLTFLAGCIGNYQLHPPPIHNLDIASCTHDSDCIVVQPVCGNQDCMVTTADCEMGCHCWTSINREHEAYWASNRDEWVDTVKCKNKKTCEVCAFYNATKCEDGRCRPTFG